MGNLDVLISMEIMTLCSRLGLGLLDAETAALINLFTSFLLLSIVWLVLAPILDGTVSIVRNDVRFYPELKDRLEEMAYTDG